jgi:phospholipid/cholesterol/gamma-HCH transport system substrate-binding protein
MAKTNRQVGFSQLRVGIFTLAALVVLVLLILNASGDFNPFERKFHLKARFANADGLREGAAVQLAGVQIGKVEDVKLMPPDTEGDAKVEAKMSLSSRIDAQPVYERIRTDSTAQLVASTVLGNDKIINITPGTMNGSPVAENHILDSTTAISINQLTATGNNLLKQFDKLSDPLNQILNKANQGEGTLGRVINDEQLYNNLNNTLGDTKLAIDQAKNTIRRIDSLVNQAKEGQGTAGKFLNDPQLYNNLNETVLELQAVTNDLRAGRGTIGKLLTDDKLLRQFDALSGDVQKTLADARAAIARLNTISDQAQTIVADINLGKGTAGKFLKDEEFYNEARQTLARLNATTDKFNAVLDDLNSGKGSAGKFLKDESLYNNINQLSSESNKLIYDFRQNPKKFLTIKLELF